MFALTGNFFLPLSLFSLFLLCRGYPGPGPRVTSAITCRVVNPTSLTLHERTSLLLQSELGRRGFAWPPPLDLEGGDDDDDDDDHGDSDHCDGDPTLRFPTSVT